MRLRIDSFQMQKSDLLALDWGVVGQAQADDRAENSCEVNWCTIPISLITTSHVRLSKEGKVPFPCCAGFNPRGAADPGRRDVLIAAEFSL